MSNKRQCKKCYCSCVSHGKRKSKFNLQHFTHRKAGYEDQWQYYPGYDASFDEDYRRQGDAYGDDFDRRSVHSEQSVHSSHSHHSRRSSFSSRSQQAIFFPTYVSQVFCVCSYLAEPQMETRPKFMSNHCRNIVKAKINLQILFPCIIFFFFKCFICIINNNSLFVTEPSVQEPA